MLGLLSILISLFLPQGQSFDANLKGYLDEKLNGYLKIEYEIVQGPKTYSKIEINESKNFRISKNFAYVPINVYDSKNLVSSSLMTLKVKLFKNVLIAKSEIPKNENLTINLFTVKQSEVSMTEGKIIDFNADLSALRSKVQIKEGATLCDNAVELIPIIFLGDKVILHAGKAGVDIAIDVVARQNGNLGDIISVHSPGGKLFKAKIVDKNNLILVE